MHVTSALATGATAYNHAHTGERAGSEGLAVKDSTEQNAKQYDAADIAIEQKRVAEAMKSNEPLSISDYGYSGVLNPGQMTIIMLEDYSRKIEEISSLTQKTEPQTEVRSQQQSEEETTPQVVVPGEDGAVSGEAAASDSTISAPYDAPDGSASANPKAQAAAQTYQHRADEQKQQDLATA